jgi:uncharacterized protein (TIGR03435 family)
LKRFIIGSFGLGPNQILGGPSWLDTDRFEIAAMAEQPVDDDVLDRIMQSSLPSVSSWPATKKPR